MLYIFLVLTILAVSFITGSIAAACFSIIILVIGFIYCNKTKAGKPSDAQKVFLVSFVVFYILALIRVLDIGIYDSSFDTIFKSGGDEDDFFEISQIAAKQSSFYDAVPNITNTLIHSFSGDLVSVMMAAGYHMYIGFIGFISGHFFDGNVIIVQLLGSCLFGCLLSVVLYKTIALYLPSKKSMKYALLGTLCTAFLYYSVCLLRDIHVSFFFALVFYTILQPFSKKNIIKLIILVLITASFRVWSAIFMSVFVLFYLYNRIKTNKLAVIVLSGVALIIVFISALPLLGGAVERLLVASRNIESRTVEESGYLQILYGLPTPVKELAIIASSYLTPFTAWNELSTSNNLYHSIFTFTIVVYEFFWFFVVWLTTKWCIFNKGLKKMPEMLCWLLMIVLGYLFVSSSSDFTVRRTMCMYPIIYLIFVCLKENIIPPKQVRKDCIAPLVFYIAGLIVFVIIK